MPPKKNTKVKHQKLKSSKEERELTEYVGPFEPGKEER